MWGTTLTPAYWRTSVQTFNHSEMPPHQRRVGLHEVYALAIEERLDGPMGIPVFAARDGQARFTLDPRVALQCSGQMGSSIQNGL